MINPNLLYSVLLGVFLVLDLLVAAARGAFSSINLPRLLTLKDEMGDKVAKLINALESPGKYLAGLYILQMLLRFAILGMAFLLLYNVGMINGENVLIFVLLILVGSVIIAWMEWILAAVTSRQAEMWGLRLESFIRFVGWSMTPLSVLPLTIVREGNGKVQSVIRVTEAELKTMVDAGEQEGLIEQEERKMIYSIFDLGETLAREIMVPRIDVLALEVRTNIDKAVDALIDSGYSRLPVYEETIDNILGLLYAKDLLGAWNSGNPIEELHNLVRPAYFIPEAKKVDELLTEMQTRRIHMAIVVDEYGGVAGIVTLEDIVEEIVGEIRDEYDLREEAFFQEISADEYLCSGRMDLDDFNELLGVNLPDDDADTLGGYIYSQIGRVPIGGESIVMDNLSITVEQVSKRRIRKVRAKRIQPPVDTEMEETHVKQ